MSTEEWLGLAAGMTLVDAFGDMPGNFQRQTDDDRDEKEQTQDGTSKMEQRGLRRDTC